MILVMLLAVALAAWFGLRGTLGPGTVVVLGALALLVLSRHRTAALGPLPGPRFFSKLAGALHVVLLFGWELVVSNLQQLRVVFGPARLVQPHWLQFRTEIESPLLRALLGMMISLTPGTMTVDIDDDGTVSIHVLVAEDDATVIRRLRDTLECPLRRLER